MRACVPACMPVSNNSRRPVDLFVYNLSSLFSCFCSLLNPCRINGLSYDRLIVLADTEAVVSVIINRVYRCTYLEVPLVLNIDCCCRSFLR